MESKINWTEILSQTGWIGFGDTTCGFVPQEAEVKDGFITCKKASEERQQEETLVLNFYTERKGKIIHTGAYQVSFLGLVCTIKI